MIIDIGVESNHSCFLSLSNFPITNTKRGEAEARNEANRDHKQEEGGGREEEGTKMSVGENQIGGRVER